MSNHMNDDKLNLLKTTGTPAPDEAARRRALDAAMLAFDTEQEKTARAPQGNQIIDRLRSIFASQKGKWTMDHRLAYGLGTAALALFLLPLGYQLYTSTAITPVGVPPVVPTTTMTETKVAPQPEPLALGRADADKKELGAEVSADAPVTTLSESANEMGGIL